MNQEYSKLKLYAMVNELAKNIKNNKRKGDGAINDCFGVQAKGLLRIETYDQDHNVLEVIEQPNKIMDVARDFLVKALAGEPTRILWEEPWVDNASDISTLRWVLTYEQPQPLYKNKYTDPVSGTYYLYERTPKNVDSVAVYPRPYSTHTVNWMCMGDGKGYMLNSSGPQFVYSDASGMESGDWVQYGTAMSTAVAGDKVSLSFVGKHLDLYFTTAPNGCIVDVTVDGDPVTIIDPLGNAVSQVDLYAASMSEEPVKFMISGEFEVTDIEGHEIVHELVLSHSGTQNASATTPSKVYFDGVFADAVFADKPELSREIPLKQNVFETPEVYNTSIAAPYKIEVLHPNIVIGSETVYAYGAQLEHAGYDGGGNPIGPAEGQYQYLFDTVVEEVIVDEEALSGAVNGTNVNFTTANKPVRIDSYEVWLDKSVTGEVLTPNGDYTVYTALRSFKSGSVSVYINGIERTTGFTINSSAGTITFITPRSSTDTVTADYIWVDTQEESIDYTIDITDGIITFNAAPLVNSQPMISYTADVERQFCVGFYFAEQLSGVSVSYVSDTEYDTNYDRALIEKATSGPNYPYYNYRDGAITFVADFPPGVPNYNIVVRELALSDGPINQLLSQFMSGDFYSSGDQSLPKMFSITRISGVTKTENVGLRITWTIFLQLA